MRKWMTIAATAVLSLVLAGVALADFNQASKHLPDRHARGEVDRNQGRHPLDHLAGRGAEGGQARRARLPRRDEVQPLAR
jgi:hypothetical protein